MCENFKIRILVEQNVYQSPGQKTEPKNRIGTEPKYLKPKSD